MLSTIVVIELEDAEQFGRAHRRLVNAANDAAADAVPAMTQGMGGVEITSRRSDGVEFFTLTFPGLPIPAEVCWTIHGDHLMAALSPRSLVEAMSQAGGDGESFADNPMLRDMAGGAGAELVSVQYTDAPRFARQGYWLVNTMCAALSNALRTGDGADPGIPLPAFNDFIEGIEPTMMVSYWDGDDMKINGRSDASVLVNLAGSSGAILGPLAVGAAAGAALPALGEARETARQTVSMANLRQVTMAMMMYSADNRDRVPESIDDLAEYLSIDLASPLGPSIDGGPDYAIRSDLGGSNAARIADPATTLAAIDRASVVNGGEKVLVAFFDGHVESIYSWELSDLLAQEQNRGAFEAFGLPDWLNPGF
jgi:prepilin-type processing-associated H-X9-DG protein